MHWSPSSGLDYTCVVSCTQQRLHCIDCVNVVGGGGGGGGGGAGWGGEGCGWGARGGVTAMKGRGGAGGLAS